MSPGQARAAFSAFVALSGGIVFNALYLQNDPSAIAAAKAAAERAAAKAELQRVRRLSIDAGERKKARRRVTRRTAAAKRARHGASKAKLRRTAELRQDAGRVNVPAAGSGLDRRPQSDIVSAVQRELSERGYKPGAVDGLPGLMTRAAIMAFENDHAMALTGEPTEALFRRILFGATDASAGETAGLPAGATPSAEQVIRTVQQSLIGLGYHNGRADGSVGERTRRAIREFEMDHGMIPTGRISGHLVAQLAKLAGQGRLAAKRK